MSLEQQHNPSTSAVPKDKKTLIKGLNNYLHKLYGDEIEVSFSQLGNSYNGLSGKSGDDFGSGKPYITYVNVYQNNIVDEAMVGYVNLSEEERQNTVHYGDALFTISSETPDEVGISAVYLGTKEYLYLNSFCFGYRLYDFTKINPMYMPYCFSSHLFRRFVYPLAQGSTRFNLHMTDFFNKKFRIPTPQNQLRILNLLNSFSEKLGMEKKIFSAYQQQKAFFLQKLFI